jgi:hypothetical protein
MRKNESVFLAFDKGSRIELMKDKSLQNMTNNNVSSVVGYAHLAASLYHLILAHLKFPRIVFDFCFRSSFISSFFKACMSRDASLSAFFSSSFSFLKNSSSVLE